MVKLPIRLDNDPIVEAIFEIRFNSNIDNFSDIFPGVIYSEVKELFPKVESFSLPSLPPEIIDKDPNLRYSPSIKLMGDTHLLQIGNHVITLSHKFPYEGWESFQKRILQITKLAEDSDLIQEVERIAIKYVNFIPSTNPASGGTDKLRLEVKVGEQLITTDGLSLRREYHQGEFLVITNVISHARVNTNDSTPSLAEGVLFDIDIIYQENSNSLWEDIPVILEKAHALEKEIFFDLLSAETLKSCGPVWE